MKTLNPFYKKKKFVTLKKIIEKIDVVDDGLNKKNFKIVDIKDLNSSNKNDITFLHSKKYINLSSNTKAKYCITNNKFKNFLPSTCVPLIVKNVLLSVSNVTKLFYSNATNDNFDEKSYILKKNNKFSNLKFGHNVRIGLNVKIGKNSSIGHNSIIESNVIIGKNCSIGSNVIIRKSLIGDNVKILDGAVIGKKGFGFFPKKNLNIRYPHIGMVIIKDNVEIGCNNTIDRGSLSNTVIDENTFLDNQVHIAHNVKIGKNCIIAGQVGFAGSCQIGDNVLIGGQAGISGHIKVGNNVQIGGGSGVIKDIPDNSKVMGYPAKDIRKFIKENK